MSAGSSSFIRRKISDLVQFSHWKIKILDHFGSLVNLIPRLVIAWVFWKSGVHKLPQGFLGIGKGDWSSTLLLFEYEHPVPGLSPELAAYLGTGFEILCPILLVLGLGTRVAAVILLSMTAVIEFTYQHSMDHVYWATLLVILLFQGGGKLSVDYLIYSNTKRK